MTIRIYPAAGNAGASAMGPFLAAGEIIAGSRKGRRDKSSNGEESPEAVQKNLICNLIGVLVFLSNRPMSIRVSGCRRGGIHRRCQHHCHRRVTAAC